MKTSIGHNEKKNVTPHALIVALVVVCLFITPIAIVKLHGEVGWVEALWGGWKIFIFYALVFVFLFVIEIFLLKSEKYRNSWLCKELGRKSNGENI